MKKLFGFLLVFVSCFAFAKEKENSFEHGDWELVCDNTGTCRAAGYANREKNLHYDISILITRKAGPATSLHLDFAIYDNDIHWKNEPYNGIISIGKQFFKNIKTGDLNTIKNKLLPLLLKESELIYSVDNKRFVLSLTGINAVLRKMDEFQGRVGTIGAIVAKGDGSEKNTPKAEALPVVIVPKYLEHDIKDTLLKEKALSLTKVESSECNSSQNFGKKPIDFFILDRLNQNNYLYYTFYCTDGNRTSFGAAYLINKSFTKFTNVLGGFNDLSKYGFTLNEGGPRWYTYSQAWNGQEFVKTYQSSCGMCGLNSYWDLPTYVSEVIDHNTKNNKQIKQ